MIDPADLDNRFDFHPAAPESSAAVKHQDIRRACRDLAELVNALVPDGREKSLAITALEETMMWSNAGIARGGAR